MSYRILSPKDHRGAGIHMVGLSVPLLYVRHFSYIGITYDLLYIKGDHILETCGFKYQTYVIAMRESILIGTM